MEHACRRGHHSTGQQSDVEAKERNTDNMYMLWEMERELRWGGVVLRDRTFLIWYSNSSSSNLT
jgi:hypothetical protein